VPIDQSRVYSSIRPMSMDDLEKVWLWRNQWRVRRYMFNQAEISWDEHKLWYERASQNSRTHLLIFEIEGYPSGFVSFSESISGRIADWSFHTAPDVRKGSGSMLCSTALQYGFKKLNLHKICGQVLDFNKSSMRIHEKLGFALEGIMHEGYHDGNAYHSIYVYGIFESRVE